MKTYEVLKQQVPKAAKTNVPDVFTYTAKFEFVTTLQAVDGPDAIAKAYTLPPFQAMKRTKLAGFPVVREI